MAVDELIYFAQNPKVSRKKITIKLNPSNPYSNVQIFKISKLNGFLFFFIKYPRIFNSFAFTGKLHTSSSFLVYAALYKVII